MKKSHLKIFIGFVSIIVLVFIGIIIIKSINYSVVYRKINSIARNDGTSLFTLHSPAVYNNALEIVRDNVRLSIKPLQAFAGERKILSDKQKILIQYIDTYPQVDILQTVGVDDLKEDLILKSPGHPLVFKYEINVNDFLWEIDINGDILFKNKAKNDRFSIVKQESGYITAENIIDYNNGHQIMFKIPAPFMVDDNGVKSDTSDVVVEIDNNDLILRINEDWLKNHKYPIRLDPTVQTPEIEKESIEFGDKNSPTLDPHVKIGRWGSEAYVGLSYNLPGQVDVSLANNTLNFSNNGQVEVEIYNKEPEIINPDSDSQYILNKDGGIEFDLILKTVPATNIFNYQLDTEGLVFYYQPEISDQVAQEVLNRYEKMKKSVKPENYTDNEWQARLADLPQNLIEVKRQMRPEDIVGSYAVYHQEKSGDFTQLGGKNYRTGKAFHIYRPKVYDANGNWIYADLNINNTQTMLSVEVNKEWLDQAEYPVRIDPNFGYETAGRSTINAYYISGAPYSSGGSGTVSSISAYMTANDSAAAGFAIYDSDKNYVGSAAVSSPVTDWNSANTSEEPDPSVGDATYWLYLWQIENSRDGFHYDTGGGDYNLVYNTYPLFNKGGPTEWPNRLLSEYFKTNCVFIACLGDVYIFSVYATYSSLVPEIISVTDSPDPVNVGSNINFEVNWNADDSTTGEAYVCTTNSFNSSALECNDASWGSGSSISTPITIGYNTQSYDIGINNYYVFLCIGADNCTNSYSGDFTVQPKSTLDVQGVYNFQGQVNISAE